MATGTARAVVGWAVAAAGLALVAAWLEPGVELEVVAWGHKVEVAACGSSLSVPLGQSGVTRVELVASDGIYPPGGRRVQVEVADAVVAAARLPFRFALPSGPAPPVGDWYVDHRRQMQPVWAVDVGPGWPVVVRAGLTGRFQSGVGVVLDGDPTVTAVVRSGLLNNDVLILDAAGAVVASSSVDPAPARDLAATAALLLGAAAWAAGLIAVATLVASLVGHWRRLAAWPPLPTPSRAVVAVAVAVAATVAVLRSAWVASEVLERLPHLPDSLTYLVQARWLLQGRLTGLAPLVSGYQDIPFTYEVGHRLVGHYPVVWPAVLALGEAFGAAWLVAPLLAAPFTWLVYRLGREVGGRASAFLAVALSVASPMAALMFACPLSHALAATLVAAFLWLWLRARRAGSAAAAAVAGVALAAAFGARPLTAAAVAVAAVGLVVVDVAAPAGQRWSPRLLASAALAAALGLVPTLLANRAITGAWLDFPYALAGKPMVAAQLIPLGLRNLDAILAHTAPALVGWGWGVVGGSALTALPLALVGVAIFRCRRREEQFLLATVVAVALGHVVARATGLHGFGPRYWFEVFACLWTLVARGFVGLARCGDQADMKPATALTPILLAVVLVLSALVALPTRMALYRGYNGVSTVLETALAEVGASNALVLFGERRWQAWAEAARLMTADNDGDLVFARCRADHRRLLETFADRHVYLWEDDELCDLGPAADLLAAAEVAP